MTTPAFFQTIRDEIDNDPLGRGYSGMTSAEIASSLNTPDQSIPKGSLSGDGVFQATDAGEFAALSDSAKNLWMSFCSRATVDPYGSANVAFVISLFGNPSATLSALNALRVESGSRAQALGIQSVTTGDVDVALRIGAPDIVVANLRLDWMVEY